MLFPKPEVRYADDSHKAYSREQVERLLTELGYEVFYDDLQELEVIQLIGETNYDMADALTSTTILSTSFNTYNSCPHSHE